MLARLRGPLAGGEQGLRVAERAWAPAAGVSARPEPGGRGLRRARDRWISVRGGIRAYPHLRPGRGPRADMRACGWAASLFLENVF